MTDYEHMIISAERYALGRMTYIVKITVDYILEDIEKSNTSFGCTSKMKNILYVLAISTQNK